MSATGDEVAAGLADRLWTRIAAQDRLEALDEHASGATYGERLREQASLLDALVEEGIDELLGALADAPRRAQLRALCAGEAAQADDALAQAGLVVASWSGDQVSASGAGRALSVALDRLAEQTGAALRERLDRQAPR